MENKICNNCNSFFILTDRNKLKHYRCSLKNMRVKPSESCKCWKQVKQEMKSECTKTVSSVTTRVWNPRSKRHEDVKA